MDVLEGLNEAQRAAVEHTGGPLLIVAGAGSGKTRVITRRVASLVHSGVNPWQILAITFTNKAAREMRERVEQLLPDARVWISTFHSFAARVLRTSGERIGVPQDYTIVDRDDQTAILRRILRTRGEDPKAVQPSAILEQISAWKQVDDSPQKALEAATGDPFEWLAAELYSDYEEELERSHCVDFDDLLRLGKALLVHPEAGRDWRTRFQHVLVDEYQDTNAVQHQMAAALAEHSGNLTVCGDPDQSIYSWRGADVSNILDFQEHFAGTTVVRLEQNYRSSPAILEVASALIAQNTDRIDRGLFSVGEHGSLPQLRALDSDAEEARFVAREVLHLTLDQGVSASEIAVLYRTNALSRSLEAAFRSYSVPFRVIGSVEFFSRREVKDLVAFLRLRANPHDTEAFLRVVNLPPRGIGEVAQRRLLEAALTAGVSPVRLILDPETRPKLKGKAARGMEEFVALLEWVTAADDASVEVLLRELVRRLGYEEYLERSEGRLGADRMDNVRALFAEALDFDEQDGGGASEFVERRALVQDTDAFDATNETVSMMTLHSAKGLEFRVVFLVGLEATILPHRRAVEESRDLQEERRLFYVGITRAQQLLYLSYARYRAVFGRSGDQWPSPFLSEIPPSLLDRGGVPEASSPTPPGEAQLVVEAGDSQVVYEEEDPYAVDFAVGEFVEHQRFGVGEVQETAGIGPKMKLRVRFEDGDHWLVAHQFGLKKVQW